MKLKNVEDIYGLSPIQQGLLFHSLYAPDSGVYVQQTHCVLRGELNLKAFEQAWQQSVNRHSVLRTSFFWEDLDKPLQVVRQSVKLRIAIDDWRELSASEQQARLDDFLEADRRRGFELSRAPLLRLALLRLDEQRHHLIWSNHHLLLDGWSIPLLLKEVFILYQGLCRKEPVHLARVRPYSDYISWLQSRPLAEAEQFWRERLRGLSSPTMLALGRGAVARDGERGDGAEGEYREQWLRLSAAETAELSATARRSQLTLNTIAQGAWSILLSRYSGEEEVVFGATVAGRPVELRGVEQMVGLFINTLPVRVRINERERVSEWLKGLQADAAEMRQYEHSPLIEVAKWSEIPRGIPLFESVLAFENYPFDASLGEQIKQSTGLEVLDLKVHERGNNSLMVSVYPEQELQLKIEYELERFSDETITRMLGHFRQLLKAIATDPQQRVCDLQLLTGSERRQLLVEFNGASAEFQDDLCLHQLFEAQVECVPENVAVTDEDEELTYRELNERANQLAHHLRSLGVKTEARVGILLERSVEMVVALLGVLKAGGAYVPLDPQYPTERLRFMLEDAQVAVLITQRQLVATVPPHTGHLLLIDAEAEQLAQYESSNPELLSGPGNLAYIIYTSGSTGRPKGAMITHASLVNYVSAISRDFGLTAGDGFAQIASASFDVAVEEIFPALASGARVVICREIPYAKDFVALIEKKQLTAFELPVAFWHEWVYELAQAQEQLPACVRLVVVGCEKNLPERFATWQKLVAGRISLIHVFGLTETTITSTTYKPSAANAAADVKHSLPIGHPLPNIQIRILDAQMRLVPVGVAGELYIGGISLARGYHNRSELTAERFVPDPFSSEPGARMYRTGDLARYLEDGAIEFIKRIDEQVKVRGYRIELGEVEAALREMEGVRECVVVARQERDAARLVGYVVLDEEASFSVTALRQGLLRRLPEYMVPSSFVQLEELPLTPNGKVDRRALPDPDHQRPALETVRVAPSTAVEETLVQIWNEVLGLSEVGIHDNFFELGGDSILSIQIVSRANQAGLPLAPKHLFEYQTVAELALVAEQAVVTEKPSGRARGKEAVEIALTPIQRWFFAHNFAQPHHWNQSLLFEVRQRLSGAVLKQVMGWLVERHEGLRLRFRREGEKWQQRLSTDPGSSVVTEIDLSGVAQSAQREALEETAAQVQASLDLGAGPLLRAVLFELGAGQAQRLLLVAHHLIIDGVSWRILLEEMRQGYLKAATGETPVEMDQAGSFASWAERLKEYAESAAVQEQAGYWNEVEQAVDQFRLPRDMKVEGAGQHADTQQVQVELTEEQTRGLLQEVPRAYRTRINEVLLSALGRALSKWSGRRQVVVELEGHGREEIAEGVGAEVRGAVGWFTSLYPVVLEAKWDDVGEGLKAVKEQLRRVPGGGLGYGLLRYRDGEEELHGGEVLFNYLGQLDRVLDEDGPFALATESAGPPISPLAARNHVLEINSSIIDGRLQLIWNYGATVHHRRTIEQVAGDYIASLQAIIEHCRLPESRGFTPSDFPNTALTQAELNELVRVEPAIEDILVLSPMQHGMLFHRLYNPESGQYVAQFLFTIEGELNAQAFAEAWRQVVQRQSVLRTSFVWEQRDEPLQIVRDHVSLPWEQQDWRDLSATAQEERLKSYLEKDRQRGFDLTTAPLMRLLLIRSTEDTYQLLWSLAMMLLDGWSVGPLLGEVFMLYEALCRNEPAQLGHVRPYRDYINWLQRQPLGAAEHFWREKLRGFSSPTQLALNPPVSGSHAVTGRQSRQEIRLSVEETAKLGAVARRHQLTLNTMVQGAWSILLSRYSGEREVLFGMTVAGRPAELHGVDQMVGLFINTLPMRVRIDEGERVSEWLRGLQADAVEMRQYEYSPLVQVAGWSEVPRGTQLFESILVFDNYPFDRSLAAQVRQRTGLEVRDFRVLEQANSPLTITISPGAELGLTLIYGEEWFEEETISRMLGHFRQLLSAITADPQQRIGDLSLLMDLERQQLLHDFNDTAAEFPQDVCLHQLIEQQVARTPEQVAVVFEGEEVCYRELNERANQLAHHLRSLGVGPESSVGVLLERSVEMVVALLGVLKAGGAYVPLDPEYPAERLRFMLEDAQVAVLITQRQPGATMPLHIANLLRIDDEAEMLRQYESSNPELLGGAETLAYIIYTSGSTGQPKGAMNTHRGIVNRLLWMQATYGLNEQDRVLQKTPFSFDVSVWEFFWPLLTGARLVLARPGGHRDGQYLRELIIKEQITTLHFVPSMLRVFLEEEGLEQCRTLRRVISSGEELPAEVAARFFSRMNGAELHNLYGPTEAAVDVTSWECRREWEGRVPIGRPIWNTQVYVLDSEQRPVPQGVLGELYLGGVQVGRGYWQRAALTAEKFVPDPYGGERGARLYRTGDVVRQVGAGVLEYVGRADYQVKVRGFRIEVGEIESRLGEHEGIRESVVMLREDASGDKRLVAYIVPDEEYFSTVGEQPLHRLPNDLSVFHLNRNETEHLYREIFQDCSYLRHGVTLSDGDCVFDVGANIGLFTLFAQQRGHNVKTFAFEPSPVAFEKLRLNVERFGLQASLFDCGLSSKETTATFTYYPQASIMSGFYANAREERELFRTFMLNQPHAGGDEEKALLNEFADDLTEMRFESRSFTCRLRTISSVIAENNIESIDLLKVDVEKSEADVLEGIDEHDWPKVKQVVVEVHDIEGRLNRVLSLLRRHGFEIAQEVLAEGTGVYNIFARRRTNGHQSGRARTQTLRIVDHYTLTTGDLRAFLQEKLPDYMVPSSFMLLEEFPLTPNGKLDRRALPEPNGMKISTDGGYEAPRTPVEEMLAGIWSTVLGIAKVSIHDTFFDLGGHSLLATQVISRVRAAFNIEIPLPVFFKEPTVAALAANVEAALQDKSESRIPPIRPVTRNGELPLSFAQQRLWFLDQWEPSSPFYNSPSVLRLSGRLELAVLQRTLFEVVRRHEVLRTSFPTVEGQPRQRIVESWQPPLPLIDLSTLDQAQEAVKELVQREVLQPFNLATGPLLRATLLRLGAEEHVLLFTMHHIVSDGWSMGLLVREVAALYKAYLSGEESPLEELAVQYADYAVWQREWLAGEVLEGQLEYWRRQLAGAPAVLELPTDRPRPRVQSYRGATSEFRLNGELTAGLKELSRRSGVTLFMTLLAGFEVLLWRLSRQEDICVGTAIANRTRRETEGVIGFFVNTLVLRVGVSGELSFRELLGRVREVCLGAYGHQEVPFERLVEELRPERSLSHSPLFQVAFGLDNAPRAELQLPGLKLSGMELEDEVVRFDLTLWVNEEGGELSGRWTYRTELFDAERVQQMTRQWERLLQSIVMNPEAAVETLEMFTEAEKEQREIEATVREDLISEKLLMTTRKAVKLAESVTR